MRLSTSFVAVRKITSSTSSSDFDGDKIELLAHQIVKSEGIIRPLVLSRTGLESYEVVEGHFEYHAAVRAREIDLRRAEMIAAYIIDPENDDVSEAISEQIKLLGQSAINLSSNDVIIAAPIRIQEEAPNPNETTEILKSVLSKVNAYDSKLNTLGSSLQKVVETAEKITLQKTLSFDESNLEVMIQRAMDKSISDLEVMIQRAMDKSISEAKSLKTSTASPKKLQYDQEKVKSIIDGLNTFDVFQLTEKLFQAGLTTAKNIAKKVCEYRQIESYKSIEDITTRKEPNGKRFFTEETLNKLLKVW
jgi:ParB family chromosome partitioning protein